MSPDETPQEEQPKRRRRKKADPAEAPEATAASEPSSAASEPDDTEEVDPTPADVEAEEAAADVMLEADAEAEGEAPDEDAEPSAEAEDAPDEEAPAPARRRRRRGAAATEEPAAPAPAPTRRRPTRDPNLPPPVVRAHAKYVRSSARKARLVCDHIRGKTVEEARAILAHTSRAVAKDWSKLLESAVANAEHNHELVGEDLYVKAVKADEGPTIKRFQPRAMGRATKIRKRTTHLTILLTPKD